MDNEKGRTQFNLKLNLIVLAVLDVVVALGLIPYVVVGYPGFLYGWLLGSGIQLIFLVTIYYSSLTILVNSDKLRGVGLTILSSLLRFLLIAGGLILGAIYTYLLGRPDVLFLWTIFGGMLPLAPVLAITTLIGNKLRRKE